VCMKQAAFYIGVVKKIFILFYIFIYYFQQVLSI